MNRFLARSTIALALSAIPALGFAEGGRYIVKFNEGRAHAGAATLRAAGANVVLALDAQNAVAARIPEQALAGLARNPNIEYVEVDAIRIPMAVSDRTLTSGEVVPYGIPMVQADLVNYPAGALDAKRVCIIDSGYSQQHEDLRDDTNATISQNANNNGSGAWDVDSCGHGSHVAGTIMATAGNGAGVVGVAPGAALHIVKVFGNNDLNGGSCAWTYSSNLINALNGCEGAGAKIISMSLGGSVKSRTEETAFANAYKRGLLHVAAAGNAGNKTTSYPAGYASVISVAAVDANEAVASFSQQNKDVELAAPGVAVLSTVPWFEDNTLTVDGVTFTGLHVEFSGRTAGVSGAVVDGGLCGSVGAWSGKVVLCQRGSVDFNTKVQNAAAGGGVAAVIYNSAASDATCGDFAGTLGSGNSSGIPAIGVSCADGAAAKALAGASGSVVSEVAIPDSGYEAWDGTSMATPHVSGVAALIWSCFPNASNQAIRNAMNNTAKPKGAAGRDIAYGYGIVQAKAAIMSLGTSLVCSTSESGKYY